MIVFGNAGVRFNPQSTLTPPLYLAVVADMGENEYPIYDAWYNPSAQWQYRGTIVQGIAPRGDAVPPAIGWAPTDQTWVGSSYWGAILPWFLLYPGMAYTATNTRCEVYDITLYVLSLASGTWGLITTAGEPTTGAFNYDPGSGTADARTEGDGHTSYKLNVSHHPIHGWRADVAGKWAITGSDVGGVAMSVSTKLVLDDGGGTDDRANADIMMSVGVDYYPTTTFAPSGFTPTSWLPGSCVSRFSKTGNVERKHYCAAIATPPTVGTSTFHTAGGKIAQTYSELLTNLPPL